MLSHIHLRFAYVLRRERARFPLGHRASPYLPTGGRTERSRTNGPNQYRMRAVLAGLVHRLLEHS